MEEGKKWGSFVKQISNHSSNLTKARCNAMQCEKKRIDLKNQ